jgi:hypothetical protein
LSPDQAKEIFDMLEKIRDRLRAVEIRMAFGAGIFVAIQFVIGVYL